MAKAWPAYDVDDKFYATQQQWRVKLTTELPCGHKPSTNAKNKNRDTAISSALSSLKTVVNGHRCKR